MCFAFAYPLTDRFAQVVFVMVAPPGIGAKGDVALGQLVHAEDGEQCGSSKRIATLRLPSGPLSSKSATSKGAPQTPLR